jgi:CheY-like chemotaxis protein
VGDKPCNPAVSDGPAGASGGEVAGELAQMRAVAQEASGPLGSVIANLGFMHEEVAALAAELAPGSDLAERVARARSTLSAIGDALEEARRGADRVRHLVRALNAQPYANLAGSPGAPPGARTESSQRQGEATSSSRGRVLVVDDEPMIVRAIQRLLEGEHHVFMSTDPADVVEQVRGGLRFDVILCDLMMPTMSGIDVYEAIRRVDADQARRIVFMTGGAFTPRVLEFLDAIENVRIEKPLERASLRAAIRAHLSS